MSTTPGFWKCVKCRTPNPGTVYITSCIACGFPRPAPGFESLSGEAPELRCSAIGGAARRPCRSSWRPMGSRSWRRSSSNGGSSTPGGRGWCSTSPPGRLPAHALGLWAWRARAADRGGGRARGLFVAGPLMGFVVPRARLTATSAGPTIRIMTSTRAAPGHQWRISPLPRAAQDRRRLLPGVRPRPDAQRRASPSGGGIATASWSIASRFPILEDYPRSAEINEADRHYTALLYRVRLPRPGCASSSSPASTCRRPLRVPPPWRLDPSGLAPFIKLGECRNCPDVRAR